jgi:hypothetical protein
MSGQQGSNASYWPRRMSSTPPRDSYCLRAASTFQVSAHASCFPALGRSLLFSIGYPLPPAVRKIQRANDLNFHYVLDL